MTNYIITRISFKQPTKQNMKPPITLYETALTSLSLKARGKVRDIYNIDDEHMLIVTTDRLSAFDVILPDPIPGKGEVLTSVANFWFEKLGHIIPNQLTGIDPESVVQGEAEKAQVRGVDAKVGVGRQVYCGDITWRLELCSTDGVGEVRGRLEMDGDEGRVERARVMDYRDGAP